MSKALHAIYITGLTLVVIIVFMLLLIHGASYYSTPTKEKFYNKDYETLKPSGIIGHGIGIAGSTCLVIGVFGYMIRKRMRKLSRVGYLKYWLEFHIFLCSLGPVLILFHTTFKFGGIVAISFWSMVAVVVSGIIGRFIYIQIPRTIEGRELSRSEIINLKIDLGASLKKTYNVEDDTVVFISNTLEHIAESASKNAVLDILPRFRLLQTTRKKINENLGTQGVSKKDRRRIIRLIRKEMILNHRINRLATMQNLLKYWHVAHLPLALVMLVIMGIHIIIAVTFGYKWIF